ncbi:pectate lyase [Lonsdalea quercina]|uniref:pectate lyase n=1 Tax=Lonsdalea quercina TaxID=71657 RepID=UPI003975579D
MSDLNTTPTLPGSGMNNANLGSITSQNLPAERQNTGASTTEHQTALDSVAKLLAALLLTLQAASQEASEGMRPTDGSVAAGGIGGRDGQNQRNQLEMLGKLLDTLMPQNGQSTQQSATSSATHPQDLSRDTLQNAGSQALQGSLSPTQDGGGQFSSDQLSQTLMQLIAMLMDNQKSQFGQPQEGGASNGGASAVPGSQPNNRTSGAAVESPQPTETAPSAPGGATLPGTDGSSPSSSKSPVPSNDTPSATGQSGAVSFPTADNANAIVVNEPIKVGAGETFDGQGKTYVAGAGLGNGSQTEGQKPLFEVADGGSVKNVIFGDNAADGIHLHGDATIDNVHWTNVGEDALTVKENTGNPANVTITNSSAQGASDKVFQLNADANFSVDNFKVKDFGTFVRTNGGQQGNWNLNLSHVDAENGKFAFVKSDSNGLTITAQNNSLSDVNNPFKVPTSAALQVS